jgi:hypothetical protein
MPSLRHALRGGARTSSHQALKRCLLLTLVAGAACMASASSSGPEAARRTIIVREASFPDSDLAARNLGHVEVAIRSADRPTQALPEALVMIRVGARDTLRRNSDQRGVARFDTLPVGQLELVVLRIGYGAVRATVPVQGGCRTDVEVYLPVQMIGLLSAPPMPSRVEITTCR